MELVVVHFQVFHVILAVLSGVAHKGCIWSPLMTLRTISKTHMLSYECLIDHAPNP